MNNDRLIPEAKNDPIQPNNPTVQHRRKSRKVVARVYLLVIFRPIYHKKNFKHYLVNMENLLNIM